MNKILTLGILLLVLGTYIHSSAHYNEYGIYTGDGTGTVKVLYIQDLATGKIVQYNYLLNMKNTNIEAKYVCGPNGEKLPVIYKDKNQIVIASHHKISTFTLGGKEYRLYTTPWIGWIYWSLIITGTLMIVYASLRRAQPNRKTAAALAIAGLFVIFYPIYTTYSVYHTNAKENTILWVSGYTYNLDYYSPTDYYIAKMTKYGSIIMSAEIKKKTTIKEDSQSTEYTLYALAFNQNADVIQKAELNGKEVILPQKLDDFPEKINLFGVEFKHISLPGGYLLLDGYNILLIIAGIAVMVSGAKYIPSTRPPLAQSHEIFPHH